MSFEAYSVAIRLRLIDGVGAGLVGLAAGFANLNKHVAGSRAGLVALESQLNRIKMLGVVGGGAAALGVGALALLSAPIKAAREYELAFTKFKTLNLGDAVNAQADKFARSANIMGVSAKQLMGTMAESVGIFGSFAEAQKFVPQLAALNSANSAIFHGKIGDLDEGSTRALMKFMDRRGLTRDEAGFKRGLNLAEQLVTGSGGFIQFRDLANFSQQGGTAFRSLSDQGLTNMALLLQEQGGSRAGTAMMSIYQNLVAGRTPVKTMHMLEDFGLGRINQQTSGSLLNHRTTTSVFGGIKDSALLQADPTTWFRTVFLPALASHGITSEAGILKATNDLLSNRSASNQGSIMTTQLMQIARDAALTRNAMGADQVIGQFRKDPNARFADLRAKYANLMVELGEAALPMVTKAVSGLLSVVRVLTTFAHNFPGTTKLLLGAFTGLAVAAAVGGTMMLATAGLRAIGLALTLGGPGGLGASLLATAGGLGAIASKLGKFGVLGATGFAAYEAATFLGADKLGEYLSEKLFNFNHRNDPYFSNGGRGTTVHTTINMDGRKVAAAVTKHQSRAVMDPQTGISDFDSRMSPIPAGGLAY